MKKIIIKNKLYQPLNIYIDGKTNIIPAKQEMCFFSEKVKSIDDLDDGLKNMIEQNLIKIIIKEEE